MDNKFSDNVLNLCSLAGIQEAGSSVSSLSQNVREGIPTIIGTSYKTVDNGWFQERIPRIGVGASYLELKCVD